MVEDVKPGRSRRFRIVLILSLAANLLFIGLMVGAVMRHGHAGPRYRDRPPSVGAALFRALPREDKREIREAMHQRDSLVRDAERQSDFAEIRALLIAEPFSPALFCHGQPPGPEILMKVLRHEITADDAKKDVCCFLSECLFLLHSANRTDVNGNIA